MLYQIVLLVFCISATQAVIPSYFFQLFSFECPKGFIQNGTNCLIPSYSYCPDVNQLNTLYYIIPKKNDIVQPAIINKSNIKYCRYSMSKFLKINSSSNSVKIDFTSDEDEKQVNLYLDVNSTEPINQLEKKIHCYTDRYGKNIRKVKINEVITKLNNTKRYSLELDENLSRYVCYFLDAGKIEPQFTLAALATTRSKNILMPHHQLSCIDDLQNYTTFESYDELNSTYDDFFNESNIDEQFIKAARLIFPLLCFGLNTKITSDKYCFPTESGKEYSISWPLTPAMSSAVPFQPCYDEYGESVFRECILDEDGARWDDNSRDNCAIISDQDEYYEDYAFEDNRIKDAEYYEDKVDMQSAEIY